MRRIRSTFQAGTTAFLLVSTCSAWLLAQEPQAPAAAGPAPSGEPAPPGPEAASAQAAEPAPAAQSAATASAPASAPVLVAPAAVLPSPVDATSSALLAPQPAEPLPPPPPPDRLMVNDNGFLKVSALLQGWLFIEHQNGLTSERDTASYVRVRRAEIKLSGEILPEVVGYGVMIDPAKTLKFGITQAPVLPEQEPPATVAVPSIPDDTSILQDFYVSLLSDYADVSLGQFKIPVSWEGYSSSSTLLFPERALIAKTYGDRRDLGLRIEKKFERFKYFAGVYNGEGLNRLDSNNQKDLALRLEAYPIEGLMVGAVGYAAVGERNDSDVYTKDRAEGDLRLEVSGALLQAEYIHGWDKPAGADRTENHGFYAAAGYTFADMLQPVIRLGFFDRNIDEAATLASDEVWSYEFGLNWYVKKQNMKLQASVSRFDWKEHSPDTQGILAAQVAF